MIINSNTPHLWEKPQHYFCDDLKTFPQKYLTRFSQRSLDVVNKIIDVSCYLAYTSPTIFVLSTFSIKQIIIPCSIIGSTFSFIGFVSCYKEFEFKRGLINKVRTLLGLTAWAITMAIFSACICGPFSMYFSSAMTLKRFCSLTICLAWAFISLFSERFESFKKCIQDFNAKLPAKIDFDFKLQMQKEIGVSNEIFISQVMSKGFVCEEGFSLGLAILASDFQVHIYSHMNAMDFTRFTSTAKRVQNLLLKDRNNLRFTGKFLKEIHKRKWAWENQSQLNLVFYKQIIIENDLNFESFDEASLTSNINLIFRLIKKRIAIDPTRARCFLANPKIKEMFSREILNNLSDLYLALHQAYLNHGLDAHEIYAEIEDENYKNLADLAQDEYDWLHNRLACEIDSKEFEDRKDRAFLNFSSNRDPNNSRFLWWQKYHSLKETNETLKVFKNDRNAFIKKFKRGKIFFYGGLDKFILYLTYHFRENVVDFLENESPDRKLKAFVDLQATTNIPNALKTLELMSDDVIESKILEIISKLSPIDAVQAEIMVNYLLKRADKQALESGKYAW